MLSAKPNLFIVGQPKSGTSALFSFLKQHPQVDACSTKEPQFFCKDFRSQYFFLSNQQRTMENYLRLYSECNAAVVMEASTAYLFSEVAAAEIYRFNPDAKIIVMLREPVEFLYTYHKQLLRNSCKFEVEDDFVKSLDLETERKSGNCLPQDVFEPKFLHYSERVRYVSQITRFAAVFPKEQLKIIIYDDFSRNNGGVVREVMDFLGIDNEFEPSFGVVNKQVNVRNRRLKQFLDRHLFSFKQGLRHLLPGAAFRKVRSLYRQFIFSGKPVQPLDLVTKCHLKRRYRAEVEALSDYLRRDLVTEWGYEETDVVESNCPKVD